MSRNGVLLGLVVMSSFVVCHMATDLPGTPPPLATAETISSEGSMLSFTLDLKGENVSVGRGVSLNTRAFDGLLPGKTIRIKPGQRLMITYRNLLSSDGDNEYVHNELSGANETNLHLHGLHIDGDWPSDSTTRVVAPGEETDYLAIVPSSHLPGTHWLHPHRHGSTSLQVSGGASLTVIVEDLELEEGGEGMNNELTWKKRKIAEGVDDAAEVLLMFQPVYNWGRLNSLHENEFFQVSGMDDSFTLVNGLLHPVLSVKQHAWTRFRLINTAWELLNFNFSVEGCEHRLLAKDGVYIQDFPRAITGALVPPGGRADVMVRCDVASDRELYAYTDDGLSRAAATVHVEESTDEEVELGGLAFVVADVDEYLADTMEKDVLPECSCETNVPRLSYNSSERIHTSVKGLLQERELKARSHPYHQHVIPFQLKRISEDATDDNPFVEGYESYFKEGDWHDVWRGEGTIRFNPVRFTGKMVLHCHRLQHEDTGMMGIEEIVESGECNCEKIVVEENEPQGLGFGMWVVRGFVGSGLAFGVAWYLYVGKRRRSGVLSSAKGELYAPVDSLSAAEKVQLLQV